MCRKRGNYSEKQQITFRSVCIIKQIKIFCGYISFCLVLWVPSPSYYFAPSSYQKPPPILREYSQRNKPMLHIHRSLSPLQCCVLWVKIVSMLKRRRKKKNRKGGMWRRKAGCAEAGGRPPPRSQSKDDVNDPGTSRGSLIDESRHPSRRLAETVKIWPVASEHKTYRLINVGLHIAIDYGPHSWLV